MDHSIRQSFKGLINCEIFENIDHFFNLIVNVVKSFQDTIYTKGDEAACQSLKNKHFNGHFDKNIRLKYLLIMYSSMKEIRNCILKDDPKAKLQHSPIMISDIEITDENLMELKTKGLKSIEMNLNHDELYLSKYALKAFQDNNLKFKLKSDLDLFYILKILYMGDSLTWNIMKNLIRFPTKDESPKWDKGKFNEYIKNLKGSMFKEEAPELEKFLKQLNYPSD